MQSSRHQITPKKPLTEAQTTADALKQLAPPSGGRIDVDSDHECPDLMLDARCRGKVINLTISDDFIYTARETCANVPDSARNIEKYLQDESPLSKQFSVLSVESTGITGEDSTGHWTYIGYKLRYKLKPRLVHTVDFSPSRFIAGIVNNLSPETIRTEVWDGDFTYDRIVTDLFAPGHWDTSLFPYTESQIMWLKRYSEIKKDGCLAFALIHAPEIIRNYGTNQSWDTFLRSLETMQLPQQLEEWEQTSKKAITNPKKVLVVDADGVLWNGNIAESGVAGIEITERFRSFQEMLLNLKKMGMLLAISSKNNQHALLDPKNGAFSHQDMLVKPEDFVAIKANRQRKDVNLVEIAQQLNLGLDSFVFIDDTPQECELVRKSLSQVMVLDFLPNLKQLYALGVINHEVGEVTNEDKLRTELYEQNATRRNLRIQYISEEEYLSSLNMNINVLTDSRAIGHLRRLSDLSMRCNQFNLTAQHYTEEDLDRFIWNPKMIVVALEYRDNVQPNATIDGLMIVSCGESRAVIDAFFLSCRRLGYRVEEVFFAQVAHLLKESGISTVVGRYISSERNSIVGGLYKSLGFMPQNDAGADSQELWFFDLENFPIRVPSFYSRH